LRTARPSSLGQARNDGEGVPSHCHCEAKPKQSKHFEILKFTGLLCFAQCFYVDEWGVFVETAIAYPISANMLIPKFPTQRPFLCKKYFMSRFQLNAAKSLGLYRFFGLAPHRLYPYNGAFEKISIIFLQ